MDIKELWEKYYSSIKKQDWSKALAALSPIKEAQPRDPHVHLKIGDTLQRMADNAGSIQAYHQAAKILVSQGFNQKALAIYKIILRLAPKDKDAISRTEKLLEMAETVKPVLPAFKPEKEAPPATPARPEGKPSMEEIAPYYGEVTIPLETQTPEEQAKPEEEAKPSWETQIERTEIPSVPAPEEEKPEIEPPPPGEAKAEEPQRAPGGEQVTWESLEDLLQELESAPWEALQKGPPPKPSAKKETEAKDVPALFSSLTREEALNVLYKAEQRTYEDSQSIVDEGDVGDSMYIVKKGRVKVITKILDRTVELASLREGDFFGEIAFLTGRPRTASVIADGPAQILEIGRTLIEDIIEKNPSVFDKLQDFYQSRVQETIKKVKEK
jgi:tetratricopeptide (TPR) repeat protein